jgi:uncharacterized protein YdaU (DUF1376 family)
MVLPVKAAPAMPLFGDAYMADTRHLSLEEHGAYLSLLMIAWRTEGCRLPADDKRLAQMLGITVKRWLKMKPDVMAFWTLTDDGWEQKRLLKERRFVAKKSEQNADAANQRWNAKCLRNNNPDDANASSMQCERNAPPPSPKEEEKEMPAKAGDYAFFGQTIKLAPRHFNEWKRLFHSIPDIEAELSVIDGWWQQQPEGKRENWFLATKGMLNKKHQSSLGAVEQARAPPTWDGFA